MVTYQISEIYDGFAGKRDSSITLTCTPETHIFFPGNRAKLCLRSDNVHCHPSCPCEYSLFWKPLYRSLIIILIFVREIFLWKSILQKITKCFSSHKTREFGSLSLFCFICNGIFFFFFHRTTCYYFIYHSSILLPFLRTSFFFSFPLNVLHKLSFCNPHSWSSFFFVVSKSSHMSSATLSCILNFLSTSACLFECVTWCL